MDLRIIWTSLDGDSETFLPVREQSAIHREAATGQRMVGTAVVVSLTMRTDTAAGFYIPDFPKENRVPTGMLLAPIGNPASNGYSL